MRLRPVLTASLAIAVALLAVVIFNDLLPESIPGYPGMTHRVHAYSFSYQPTYTPEGNLIPPTDYREWIFVSSGYDMAYTERAPGVPEHSVFDNVFVHPDSYASFQKTGTWPDKTVMVLENRTARANGESLVKGGRFQGDISGLEIHIKDSSRFHEPGPGGQWAFFGVHDGRSHLFPRTATCYACHAEHAAVDTTFVQFYPTLLPIAELKKTLDPPYLHDRSQNSATEPK